jgi:hypothetical protein
MATANTTTPPVVTGQPKQSYNDSAPGWVWVLVIFISIALCVVGILMMLKGKDKKPEEPKIEAPIMVEVPPPPAEYPKTGEMTIYADEQAKAWIDPKKTYLRPTGPATYTFTKDQSIVFYDTASNMKLNVNSDKWQKWYPAGEYLVTPYQRDSIYFRWWTKK